MDLSMMSVSKCFCWASETLSFPIQLLHNFGSEIIHISISNFVFIQQFPFLFSFRSQSNSYFSFLFQSSSSRMRVIYHNWSATKQRPHPQSVAEISHHSVLSGDRIQQCETSSGSSCSSICRHYTEVISWKGQSKVTSSGSRWSLLSWKDQPNDALVSFLFHFLYFYLPCSNSVAKMV